MSLSAPSKRSTYRTPILPSMLPFYRDCPIKHTKPNGVGRSGFIPRFLLSRKRFSSVGSRHKAAPTVVNRPFLRRPLTLIGLFTLLSGCLNSEPGKNDTITLRLDTPSAGWKINPIEAWETVDAIHCLFQLSPPKGMSAQVISSVVSEMQLPASTKPKKRIVFGKTWNWSTNDEIEFPKSYEAFKNQLADGARRIEIILPEA